MGMHRRAAGLFGETPLFLLAALGRGSDAACAARFLLSHPLETDTPVRGLGHTRCPV